MGWEQPVTREDGYYWVKRKGGEWTVGKYWLGRWSIVGRKSTYASYDFEEIDGGRLVRKP